MSVLIPIYIRLDHLRPRSIPREMRDGNPDEMLGSFPPQEDVFGLQASLLGLGAQ